MSSASKQARRRIIPVFVPHLGCPRDCIFCNQHSIAAPKEQDISKLPGLIENELKKSGESAELAFYGGSFTAIDPYTRSEYLRAAEPFVRSGRISSIRISTRPDCITPEILNELRYYGVETIELGAQSMEDNVLLIANRGHTSDDTRKAARMIKQYGFKLILQMMIGLPGETDASPMHTATELAELEPDGIRIYPVVVIKSTELERMWREGEYNPLTPERAAQLSAEPLLMFESRGIPVIRLGLNPTEDLSGGEALAGAYHPALGEMVRSCIYLKEAEKKIDELNISEIKYLTIYVAPGKVSAMAGQHRKNILQLESEYPHIQIKIRESASLKVNEVMLAAE